MTNRRPFYAALSIITALGIFMSYMSVRYTNILASKDFCATAVSAKQMTGDGSIEIARACVGLLSTQIGAIAQNSYVYALTNAFVIAAMAVLGVVGGQFKFRGGKDGLEAEVSRQDAAQQVADAAQDKAAEISQ